MDRIEPIRPSLPPIDTTHVRKIAEERERRAAQQRQAAQRDAKRRQAQADPEQAESHEWLADEQRSQDEDQDQDGPRRIDVRA
jgi:hypothetical protein